jgi:hypothetical protein
MYAFDAPLVARFFAIEELRAAGWRHVVDPALPPDDPPGGGSTAPPRIGRSARQDAERMWSGATYCPDCSARAAARARARTNGAAVSSASLPGGR